MEPIKCVVVDDEELARGLLKAYIERLDFLTLVAEVANPLEALKILKNEGIGLLFLDIQMPEIKGTDFAKLVPPETQVVFTTAYSEYALEGFELSALDYLLKPITFERFLAAVNKVRGKREEKTSFENFSDTTITVKSGYDLHKVRYQDILFIESDSEYVHFHLKDKKIMSHQSLKKLMELLPRTLFMRVHRSYIVNRNQVTALKGRDVYIGDREIPVSAQYFEEVKRQLF
ncbi:LytR/AlgR family response regulator transcription factor [Pseudozobellia thermophila]|uniref:Two component transcriptional regulator, LytTR family n=1 Tax=Pseudozobellia thermophila TaxID=192903 RepID=A0A1M6LZJ6_9FLAO|nr:LytTR family DNA-binding domain-containing protein [Pseudozobellia thermophila]SHJ76618.1 two component transcriptional regulator, LytTR family [Pseudozobellia thermophila]